MRGLKRLALALAAVVVTGIGALAAIPFLIEADAVRDSIREEIRYVTGVQPVLRGDVLLSLFPTGAVGIEDVSLGEAADGRPALSAERLTAQLRLLPLLFGRIEIAEVTLVRPRITVAVDETGRSNWSGLAARLAQAAARTDGKGSFSEIRLVGGTVLVRQEERHTVETLDDVELSLAWPAISKSFAATGRFSWRGERLDATFTVSDFLAAAKGDRSGVKVRLNGGLFKLAFDGHAGSKPTLKVEGTMAADGPSLRKALQWAGMKPLPGGGFGRFALNAQANMVGRTLAFTGVNVEIDGNAAEGVLSLTTGGRPQLQGTLAADQIDIAPYVSTLNLLGANDSDWDRVPIKLDGLTGVELDLRLSAARVTMAGSRIGRTALAASLRGGRFVLTIGESQAFDGIVKGAIELADAPHGADLKTNLQFTGVDLEQCLGFVFGVRKIEGRGDVALALNGTGGDVLDMARTLNGVATLSATKGTLAGLNLEQMLRRLERRPLSGGGDFRSGRTPFEKLAIGVKIVDGMARVEDVRMDGPVVRVALDGSASIPARNLNLKGTAQLVVATKENGFELPFVVRGRWDDPVMLPDAESLIRRSGAAAPLLEAVRGGRGRDAVRSAIEQLTRGAEAPLAIAPAPSANAAPQ